jgi:RND family efflux transporter MFP subunit
MEQMMNRRAIGPLVFLVMVVFFTACSQKIEPGTTEEGDRTPVAVETAVARITQQALMYEAVGTVTARTASTISSKLMGAVREVHVREGDLVEEGDLLVTLDQRQVEAQLQKAQANAEVAAKEYRRYQQLLTTQSITQQEFDRAEARHRQAQAAVAAATVGMKDATVRAPYEGQVVAKMINPGDLASPGTPFLTLEQKGLFCADLVLPERHIQAVKMGLEVRVVVPALSDEAMTGQVGRIIPSADARSRSFQIKVGMPEDPDLKSGMFARVFIPLGGTGMLLVPQSAVVDRGQLQGVFLVDATQTARFRLVRTGKTIDDQVEVVSGLKAGGKYIVKVPAKLKDGDKVEERGK